MGMVERESWGYTYSLRVLEKIRNAPGIVPVESSCRFTASGSRLEVVDEEDGQVYEVSIVPLYRSIGENEK